MIELGAIERDDLGRLRDWRNDLLKTGVLRQRHPICMADQDRWFEDVVLLRREHIMLTVVNVNTSLDNDDPERSVIGIVGLTYIDWVRRHAEASIYVASGHRNNGSGHTALTLLLDYGFKNLGLHRITAEIYAYNEPSRRLFEQVGFKHEGVLRDHQFWQGRWHDSHLFGILDSEWIKP